jgi:hypothetical protein
MTALAAATPAAPTVARSSSHRRVPVEVPSRSARSNASDEDEDP